MIYTESAQIKVEQTLCCKNCFHALTIFFGHEINKVANRVEY
jgi:hypothetical protein